MSTKLYISTRNGLAIGVYDDRWLPLFEALGNSPSIERASDVEFDNANQVWVARDRQTGEVIQHGKQRASVIAAEVYHLESKLDQLATSEE